MDYETGPRHFSLTVEVSDDYGGSVTGHVSVNVTNVNEDPYVVRNQTFYVDENVAVGTSTDYLGNSMIVKAKDPDNLGRSYGVVEQSISFLLDFSKAIGSGRESSASFAISYGSGLLATQAELDYETTATYQLVLFISDNGCDDTRCPGSAYGNVTVMVNDVNEAPEMTAAHGSSDPVYINESAPIGTPVAELFSGSLGSNGGKGTGVYKAYALDDDTTDPEGNELAWNITSDYGLEIQKDPQTNLSYIVTGENTNLNYEILSSVNYQFSVTVFAYEVDACKDAPLHCEYISNSVEIYVQVLNVDEAPTMSNVTSITVQSYDCNTAEDTAPCNTQILDISGYASDPESGDMAYNLTRAINSECSSSCPRWCNDTAQGEFYVSGNYLYLRELPDNDVYGPVAKTASDCDPDVCGSCPFTLRLYIWANDGRFESDRVAVNVYVSGEDVTSPSIESHLVTYIDEDIADGTVIRLPWNAYYSDTREGLTSFSLETSTYDFNLNSTNGWLVVNTGASIDFETTQDYNFTVSFTDSVLTTYGTVRVIVQNVNEAPSLPNDLQNDIYAKLLWVYENATTGHNLTYKIAATDYDSADLGELTYVLDMDDKSAPFAIRTTPQAGSQSSVQTKGIVYVTDGSALDYETTSSYTGWINVTDKEGLKDSTRITIYVYDINEPPQISSATFYYDEDDTTRKVGSITSIVDDPEADTLAWNITNIEPSVSNGPLFTVQYGAIDYLYIA